MVRVCNNVNFGSIVKEIRKKRKISQEELGLRVGVTGKTVSSYEKNKIKPSVNVFLKILNVGGFSLAIVDDIYKNPKELNIPN